MAWIDRRDDGKPRPTLKSPSCKAGGTHSQDVVRTNEQAFRGELCTGFYRAKSGDKKGSMIRVLAHTIMALALKADDKLFGDQAATNLVLFESPFRGLGRPPTVQVSDPDLICRE